jgi:hypothetical protein
MSANVAPPGYKSTLATEDQKFVEQRVLRIMADPRVKAAQARSRKLLEDNPLSKLPDGKANLDQALEKWLSFLAFQEANADPAHPRVAWTPTNSANTWFGHTAPAAGGAVDNPDNIYRHIPVDSHSRYVVHGQLQPLHPAQFTFQLLYHDGTIPTGNDNTSLGVISSKDMVIAADGSFVVTCDADPANGRPNHIQAPPGKLLRLLSRDTVTNWLQRPSVITVERSGPATPAITEEEITARVADQLYDWVDGWLKYISHWAGPPAWNALIPPYGRAGGWGYISPMRFSLADDEALIVTFDDGASEYGAIQLCDVWTMATDPQKYVSSYTSPQARPNADGTYTYVVAVRDPGAANWVDTAGMHQGWVAVRWQGVPRTRANSDGLLREVRVVKVGELASILPSEARGITPAQRKQAFAQRAAEWRLRTTT